MSAIVQEREHLAGSRQVVATPGQRRLWFLDQLEPGQLFHHTLSAFRLHGTLDADTLEAGLAAIRSRHEVLRTHFIVVDGEPLQAIEDESDWRILRGTVADEAELRARIDEAVQKPFDLMQGPLMRAHLWRVGDAATDHVLLLNAHHTIADDGSMGLLLRELEREYAARLAGVDAAIPAPTLQYADYTLQQCDWLQRGATQHLAYWTRHLQGAPERLDLPTDNARSAIQRHEGGAAPFDLGPQLSAQLRALSLHQGCSLYAMLLTGLSIVLGRYSGQCDVLVGSPIANRDRRELSEALGPFANTLVMRARLYGRVGDVLLAIDEQARRAHEHRDVPFEALVQTLQPEHALSRNPLVQVMFALDDSPRPSLSLESLSITELVCASTIAHFDLSVVVIDGVQTLGGEWEYDCALWQVQTVQRMQAHWRQVLEAMVGAGGLAHDVWEVALLSEAEREQLLNEWNATSCSYERTQNVVSLFAAQVQRHGDRIALGYEGDVLTYAGLDRQSNRLARHLRRQGVIRGTIVGLALERSLDLVVALLAILKAGAAYLPLDPSYPIERLRHMLEDAGASVLVGRRAEAQALELDDRAAIWLDDATVAAAIAQEQDEPLAPIHGGGDLAYIIYTSGSTGQPKGVGIAHANLMSSTAARLSYYVEQNDPEQPPFQFLLISSVAFDSSVAGIFGTLCGGGSLHLISGQGSREPLRIANVIKAHGITHTLAVPSLYEAILRVGAPSKLSSLRCVVVAGESCPKTLLALHRGHLPHAVLHNEYGPTEGTVWSTVGKDTHLIGRPVGNVSIYILDSHMSPVPPLVTGELYIGGDGVSALGYLNKPDITASVFVPDPFDSSPGRRLYRTGDMAFYRPDGAIEFVGRKDGQVKLNGVRIELDEIRAHLNSFPEIRDSVVLVGEEDDRRKLLVAYYVSRRPVDRQTLVDLLKSRLLPSSIPHLFAHLSKFPLTLTGKLNVKALPSISDVRKSMAAVKVPAETEAQASLCRIWFDVTGVEQIGITDNFFELGGHSMMAIQMLSRIAQEYRVEVPLRWFYENPTVKALAQFIDGATTHVPDIQSMRIVPVSRERDLPLSYAQRRMWFLEQLAPGRGIYNVTYPFQLLGQLHVEALERALSTLIRRHEILRTRFPDIEGRPVQVVDTFDQAWRMESVQATSDLAIDALVEAAAAQAFNLADGPAFRVSLAARSERRHILIISMHHIVIDGWSMELLFRELAQAYRAYCNDTVPALGEVHLQYADYAHWEQSTADFQGNLGYWKTKLAGAPAILAMPMHRPRLAEQSHRGGSEAFAFDSELTYRLRSLTTAVGCSMYMTLLALFQLLLSHYSRRSDILVGSPVANRNKPELEGVLGFFVNMLVMRTGVNGSSSGRQLLEQVRQVVLEAYEHQDMPLEMLVEAICPQRSLDHHPVFQNVLSFHRANWEVLDLDGLEVRAIPKTWATSKFDLLLEVWDDDSTLSCAFEYNADLYGSDDVRHMAREFERLARDLVDDPSRPVDELGSRGQAPAARVGDKLSQLLGDNFDIGSG
ncbi:MAG TPA: amino acid adenylation domain-containing protein [Dyella sp.]|uniref:non-ribosomal peptide synthetase n=1 Tax=Dyella sp. TaxID=1869338 RepID=UPI002BDD6E7C|nr:non-ribosomal peptide synthetase [Dyella sp.]HTV87187.1 amino acid adenylation domain-containing protein [Dyella sp.]